MIELIKLHEAIYKLNPSVLTVRNDIAYDADDNEVAYDLQAATAQAQADIQAATAQAQADAQASIAVKESAMSKLAAIGLTPAEITALLGA